MFLYKTQSSAKRQYHSIDSIYCKILLRYSNLDEQCHEHVCHVHLKRHSDNHLTCFMSYANIDGTCHPEGHDQLF